MFFCLARAGLAVINTYVLHTSSSLYRCFLADALTRASKAALRIGALS